MRRFASAAFVCALCLQAPSSDARPEADDVLRMALPADTLAARVERFVPVRLGVSPGTVAPELVPLVEPLRRAADHLDEAFWRQQSPEGREMLRALDGAPGPAAAAVRRLLAIHHGPWDAFAADAPFVGSAPRPPGVGYYPNDLSRRELDAFLAVHPDAAPALWSPYTVVARRGDALVGVPYSRAYEAELKAAASALREAAGSYGCDGDGCPCAGLVRYLKARAASLLDDDYASSEALWLQAGDCPLDVALGPYEFYADRLLGLKAAFEAILYYRSDEDTARFARLRGHHGELVGRLPLDDALRARFRVVEPAPVTVADVLYTGGEARAAMQIRAFLLPNDERVVRAHGSKGVILRNVVRAKFDHLVRPVARELLGAGADKQVAFDAYFDFLLAWQLAHGLVPSDVAQADGRVVSPRQLLRARHTPVDAVKGEAVALLNWLALRDRGLVTRHGDDVMAATYLASLFDAARLAEGAPQTLAKVIVYNRLAAAGVFRYEPRTRTYTVAAAPLRPALEGLAHETLDILARGDYEGAGRLIVREGIMPPEMRQKLEALEGVPLEILPEYTLAAGS